MRNVLFAVAAAAVFGALGAPSTSSAAEFKYCLQSDDTGYPGDCQYRSFAECQATASGRNAGCGINPRFAYAQQQRDPFRR